jgi:hypothetical protein
MHIKVASPSGAGYKAFPVLSVVVGSTESATAEALSVEVLVEVPSSSDPFEDGALVSVVPVSLTIVVCGLSVVDASLLADHVSEADSTSPEVV